MEITIAPEGAQAVLKMRGPGHLRVEMGAWADRRRSDDRRYCCFAKPLVFLVLAGGSTACKQHNAYTVARPWAHLPGGAPLDEAGWSCTVRFQADRRLTAFFSPCRLRTRFRGLEAEEGGVL